MDINAARAAEANGSMDKVGELLTWRDSKLFSEAERVALDYAERITYTDRSVDDAFFARLGATPRRGRRATVVVAFELPLEVQSSALNIEAQGFCVVPKR
jgi:alkylhydroperoxidase family enzyme